MPERRAAMNFRSLLWREHLSRHDVALVSDAALPLVRFLLVIRRANDEDVAVLADRRLHELRELITRDNFPLVERDVYAVAAEPRGQVLDPFFVLLAIP